MYAIRSYYDYFHDSAYPSYLMYNPFIEDKVVEVNFGTGPYDIYDAASNSFLKNGISGSTTLTIPSDEAVVAVSYNFV